MNSRFTYLAGVSSTPDASVRLLQCPPPAYVGRSAAARRVHAQITAAARVGSPVLVVGAPGTDKRAVAEILHHFAASESGRIQTLRAGAQLPEELRGFVFIEALEAFSLAEQGQLFDLRQKGRTGRMGPQDRWVVATSLEPGSAEGRERLDPRVIRCCGCRIDLPALAERMEDVEDLALHALRETPVGRPVGGLSKAALGQLQSHGWPGNEAELRVVVRQALAVGTEATIELRDLPVGLRVRVAAGPEHAPEHYLSLEFAEREAVQRALHHAQGNKRKAARLLGIGKTTLYRKLKAFGFE